jgi:hypothetical protein
MIHVRWKAVRRDKMQTYQCEAEGIRKINYFISSLWLSEWNSSESIAILAVSIPPKPPADGWTSNTSRDGQRHGVHRTRELAELIPRPNQPHMNSIPRIKKAQRDRDGKIKKKGEKRKYNILANPTAWKVRRPCDRLLEPGYI